MPSIMAISQMTAPAKPKVTMLPIIDTAIMMNAVRL